MAYKTIDQIDVNNKRVFLRVDFNVPLSKQAPYTITDDTRIRAALPTINALLSRGAKLIVASHLGRPKGAPEDKYSLKPVFEHLRGVLSANVTFASDCVGADVEQKANQLSAGE